MPLHSNERLVFGGSLEGGEEEEEAAGDARVERRAAVSAVRVSGQAGEAVESLC